MGGLRGFHSVEVLCESRSTREYALLKDFGSSMSSFGTIFSNSNAFENWFTENHSNGKVDKIVVKRRLIDWQKRSRFGFSDTMNGNERHPKFNLVPKPE